MEYIEINAFGCLLDDLLALTSEDEGNLNSQDNVNNESGLHHDYQRWLEEVAPHAPIEQYRHNDTGEDNADAHIKRQIMGKIKLIFFQIIFSFFSLKTIT